MGKRKEKPEKIDGFGPAERKSIHSAVREVWYRSRSRKLAVKRATDSKGFIRCEKCKKRTPKHHVDHISPVGEVGGRDYIQKMFIPSRKLRVLCPPCHKPKTKKERQMKKRKLKAKAYDIGDFY